MIKKIANTIEMSFDIPESEKKEAQIIVKLFEKVIAAMNSATNHLNIMYDPFSKAQASDPELINKFRGAIFNYKEQIKKNYDKLKRVSFIAMMKFNIFSSDTHIDELISTFKNNISTLENQVESLLDLLDDLKQENFESNIVKSIDGIKKTSSETEDLIKERIIDYINTNILTKDWTEEAGSHLKEKIESKIPYITQLFLERQKALQTER